MASNTTNIHKLQQALNNRGYRLLYSTTQFYSEQQNRPVTVYHIKQCVTNEDTKKTSIVELFNATSQIRVLLFLRDMWYKENGMEIPEGNGMWKQVKTHGSMDREITQWEQ